jgi:hypothetical protein
LKRRIEHHDRVGAHLEPPHEPFPLSRADRERDLQALALALDRRAVLELRIHRLEVGIDIVHADAGFVVGVLWQLRDRGRVHRAQSVFHHRAFAIWK